MCVGWEPQLASPWSTIGHTAGSRSGGDSLPSWTSEAAGFSHTADFVDYMGRVAARSSPSASIVVHPYFPVRMEMNGVADMRKHDDLGNEGTLNEQG